MRWLFPNKEVRIDTRCLDCAEPILIRMRDEEILEANPPDYRGSYECSGLQMGRDLLGIQVKPHESLQVERAC